MAGTLEVQMEDLRLPVTEKGDLYAGFSLFVEVILTLEFKIAPQV
jgi:hypothetical protein